MFQNPVTCRLADAPREREYRSLNVHRYTEGGCTVAVVFFGGKHGLMTIRGLTEFSRLLECVGDDPELSGLILTDNNPVREDGRHLSLPGLDIKAEFVHTFEAIANGDEGPMRALLTAGQRAVEGVAKSQKPIVGAIAGDAYGGGVELLAFTYSILGEAARIALPECRLDVPGFLERNRITLALGKKTIEHPCCLFPGWHGHRSLLHRMWELSRIPATLATIRNDQFVFRGINGQLDASTAHEIGMIDEVHRADELFEAAFGHVKQGVVHRTLDNWSSPVRPTEVPPRDSRDTLGARACDQSLYENSGSWQEIGHRDADLMIQAIRDAMV